MKEALLILGHKRVHHAYELYTHPEQANKWLAAWEAKVSGRPIDWSFLQGYTAVTDMPAACFAPELIKAFPDAKVVLVVRDEQAWRKSFQTVIDAYFDNSQVTAVVSLLDWKLMRPIHTLWTRLFATKDGCFRSETKQQMEANALEVYREHNNKVDGFRFRLQDGWGPLCEYLEVDVPGVPFPNVNEGDAVKEVVAAFVKRSMRNAALNLTVVLIVVAAAAWQIFGRQ